jgi:hypothetical protein
LLLVSAVEKRVLEEEGEEAEKEAKRLKVVPESDDGKEVAEEEPDLFEISSGTEKSKETLDEDDNSISIISRSRHSSKEATAASEGSKDQSVIIQSADVSLSRAEHSVIVLDSSSEDLATRNRRRMSAEDTNGESETIFTKVKRSPEKKKVVDVEETTESSDATTTTAANPDTPAVATASGGNDSDAVIADDEASCSLKRDNTSAEHSSFPSEILKRPDSGLSAAENSPNISGVSPIQHESVNKKLEQFRQTRKTSTPGTSEVAAVAAKRSPKKRTLQKETKADTSGDEGKTEAEAPKKRKTSPKKNKTDKSKEKSVTSVAAGTSSIKNLSQEFKVPSDPNMVNLLIFRDLDQSAMEKLKQLATELHKTATEVKISKESDTCRQLFSEDSPQPPGHSTQKRQPRVSDVTSLSSNSRSSSSTGYLADHSSVTTGSSSSDGSKRSRLSIMPELSIEPHSVVSPLPGIKGFVRPKRGAAATRAKGKIDDDGGIEGALPGIPEEKKSATTPAPMPPSTPNAKSTIVADNEIYPDVVVFAKYTEITRVRYWPGTVVRMAEVSEAAGAVPEKWEVRFTTDDVIVTLKTDDLIPATSLKPGHKVNVLDDGTYRSGVVKSHADLSDNKVSYEVHFDDVPGQPANECQLVPYTDMILTPDSVRTVRRDLGGQWATPTKTVVSRGQISLDNLVDSKRRSGRSSSTPTSAVGVTPAAAASSGRKERGQPKVKKGGDFVETSAVEETENEGATTSSSARKRGASTPSARELENIKY